MTPQYRGPSALLYVGALRVGKRKRFLRRNHHVPDSTKNIKFLDPLTLRSLILPPQINMEWRYVVDMTVI